jgi:hypothetical protein
MGFQVPPASDQVNVTFALANGILSWITADLSATANFYLCGGYLYAAFLGTRPAGDWISVVAGAVAASARISRVQQTRTTATPPSTAVATAQPTLPAAILAPRTVTADPAPSAQTARLQSRTAAIRSARMREGVVLR